MTEIITKEMEEIRGLIVETVAKRNQLKAQMQSWYDEYPARRFEHSNDLITLDAALSSLDSHYKRLWDYYNNKSKAC